MAEPRSSGEIRILGREFDSIDISPVTEKGSLLVEVYQKKDGSDCFVKTNPGYRCGKKCHDLFQYVIFVPNEERKIYIVESIIPPEYIAPFAKSENGIKSTDDLEELAARGCLRADRRPYGITKYEKDGILWGVKRDERVNCSTGMRFYIDPTERTFGLDINPEAEETFKIIRSKINSQPPHENFGPNSMRMLRRDAVFVLERIKECQPLGDGYIRKLFNANPDGVIDFFRMGILQPTPGSKEYVN